VKCPFCGAPDTRVVDSRETDDAQAIRRRRECAQCARRFTTYERQEDVRISVVKKDGRREPFDRRKILAGVLKACEKRPVSRDTIESAVGRIEAELQNRLVTEVPAKDIGEMVMAWLRQVDDVAYVRFASVYKEFADAGRFLEEVRELVPPAEGPDTGP
jgi:transcriptional repressor NrdR